MAPVDNLARYPSMLRFVIKGVSGCSFELIKWEMYCNRDSLQVQSCSRLTQEDGDWHGGVIAKFRPEISDVPKIHQ